MFTDVSYTYGMQEWGNSPAVPDEDAEGGHILHTPRTPVRDLMDFDEDGNLIEGSPNNKLPEKYVHYLQREQRIATCCRHVENHHVSIWYSCEDNRLRGVPDVHRFVCTSCHPVDYKTDPETGEFVLDENGNKIEHETRGPNREKWHRMFLVEPFKMVSRLT